MSKEGACKHFPSWGHRKEFTTFPPQAALLPRLLMQRCRGNACHVNLIQSLLQTQFAQNKAVLQICPKPPIKANKNHGPLGAQT